MPTENKQSILSVFSAHTPQLIVDSTCRTSAVCIPFVETEKGLEILFELRRSTLSENAGDICFPGGMPEEGEEPLATALREIKEELLLTDGQLQLLGTGDVFHNFAVTVHSFPVLIKGYTGTFSRAETERVFTVPLDTLLSAEPDAVPMEWVALLPESFPADRISGGRNHKFRRQKYIQYFYPTPYGWIWGITGKLLHACLETLKQC